jgi:hypothetical protein
MLIWLKEEENIQNIYNNNNSTNENGATHSRLTYFPYVSGSN